MPSFETEPLLDLQAVKIRLAEAAGPAAPPGGHDDEIVMDSEGFRSDPLQKACRSIGLLPADQLSSTQEMKSQSLDLAMQLACQGPHCHP